MNFFVYVGEQALAIAASFKTDLDTFYDLVDGRLVAIHDMLNTIGANMCGRVREVYSTVHFQTPHPTHK